MSIPHPFEQSSDVMRPSGRDPHMEVMFFIGAEHSSDRLYALARTITLTPNVLRVEFLDDMMYVLFSNRETMLDSVTLNRTMMLAMYVLTDAYELRRRRTFRNWRLNSVNRSIVAAARRMEKHDPLIHIPAGQQAVFGTPEGDVHYSKSKHLMLCAYYARDAD